MDKTYAIRYTPLAREDLLDVLRYISEESDAPTSARRILDKIESDIALLRENPYIAPLSRDRYLSTQGYRALVSGKYLVFYKVDDDAATVVVHRVVYGKRNLSWLGL
ncbi:MAG: type II toxin-antitoxin system RelE/ParE family toxin [Oscillospiraceae bacterium]|jgi:addiction module RelE/StbE family toxin|nr:type II toxin-antitoxin system RelE/ParE family toxin [Oscillospiraceae bacterium]